MMARKIEVFLLCSCFLVIYFCTVISEDVPITMTTSGLVSGVYETSYEGRTFSAFYGIPYARSPVGYLRFREPQRISPWSGTWKANNSKLACVQLLHVPDPPGGDYQGDEDCLYLNIFYPGRQPQNDDLDVIVYIHGGAFMYGSANTYGPKFLMDRDVVLVSINYRLGVLGFLSTEDDIVPGNNGLKDQVMALEWIQRNIEYFGGNSESVTLTGLSAGAASVHFHYLSPLSKGLFHRGISMSGTALGPSKMQENALEKARMIGAHLGCPHKSTEKMIECMKQRSTRALVEAIKILRPWLYNPYSPLAAVVEKVGYGSFLTDQPWNLLTKGKFNDLPWLNSVTSEEGLYPGAEFLVKKEYLHELNGRWDELIPHLLDYNYTVPVDKRDFVSRTIRDTYLGKNNLSSSRDVFMSFINMISDRMFCISAEDATKLQSEKSKSNVFYYYFNYMGEERESDTLSFTGIEEKHGVAHGDDTWFVFSNPEQSAEILSENDKKMKNILLEMWISFAKTNVPTAGDTYWAPVSKQSGKPLEQLHIRSPEKIYMENVDVIDRKRSMWKGLPFAENENLANHSTHVEL